MRALIGTNGEFAHSAVAFRRPGGVLENAGEIEIKGSVIYGCKPLPDYAITVGLTRKNRATSSLAINFGASSGKPDSNSRSSDGCC